MTVLADPPRDCPRCPRLVAYRAALRVAHPGWHNAPVAGWGDPEAWLLIVGLAPGVQGANRTGQPFTGDASGDLLFATLGALGLDDGVFIANAAACVPPQNKPTPEEIGNCRPYLATRIAALPRLTTIVTLGQIAHDSTVRALGGRVAAHRFSHDREHEVATYRIVSSYHCSRYNTNTGRLTPAMFEAVFRRAQTLRVISP